MIRLSSCLLALATLVAGFVLASRQNTGSGTRSDVSECSDSSAKFYVDRNHIKKGAYVHKEFKGQPLADAWLKFIPRTDTEKGHQEYENDLKELNRKARKKQKTFA